MWTKESIQALINSTNPDTARKAIERGILAIYERQTADEKAESRTKHHNNIGFDGIRGKRGSYYARWLLAGKHLTGQHYSRAKDIVLYHAGQLARIANEKAQCKVPGT